MEVSSCLSSNAERGGQGPQVGDFEVGLDICRRGSSEPFLTASPMHPDRREAKLLRGDHVVEEALGCVQEPLGSDAHPAEGYLEVVGGWFVGACLLGSDYPVELHLEVAGSQGKEAIVHVGDDRELVSPFERPERLHGVGKGLPVS